MSYDTVFGCGFKDGYDSSAMLSKRNRSKTERFGTVAIIGLPGGSI
jgi:hypothetical protein